MHRRGCEPGAAAIILLYKCTNKHFIRALRCLQVAKLSPRGERANVFSLLHASTKQEKFKVVECAVPQQATRVQKSSH